MLISLSMALNIVGLWLFAQTQRSLRRRQQRTELPSAQRGLWRVCAGLLLCAGWLCAAQNLGAQLGSLLWIAEVGVAGLMVPVILALRHEPVAKPPRRVRAAR